MQLTRTALYILSAFLVCTGMASTKEGTDGFETTLTFGTIYTDGNTDNVNANAGLDSKRVHGNDEFILVLDFNYGESANETVKRNTTGECQIRQWFTPSYYTYAGVSALRDDIADVDYRLTFGPGFGTDLVRTDTIRLNVELGAAWVAEDVGGKAPSDFWALRAAEQFSVKLSDTTKVWQSATVVSEVNYVENFILNAELGAETAITDRINLRVVLKNRFDNTPAEKDGVQLEENDISLITGFSVHL